MAKSISVVNLKELPVLHDLASLLLVPTTFKSPI